MQDETGTPSLKRVVVATHNAHKVAEIRAILAIPGWEFVSLDELGILEEPVEDANSFLGNAFIKARFAHEATGLAALADDSGLVVDALNGEPGIYSSRYAGDDASDSENNEKLLEELQGSFGEERAARFICFLVFIDEDGTEMVAEGVLEGRIAHELQGSSGFGYDPLFYPHAFDYMRTLGELLPEEKNALSHRFNALTALKEQLMSDHGASDSGDVPSGASPDPTPPHRLVVFDFDGTLIEGSSPVKLIARLNRDRIMPKMAILKSMIWGLRYKMGTELDQVKPRRYVFSSFKDFSASDANAIMHNLYKEELRPCLRPGALAALEQHRAAGSHVVIVSASFDPIIAACCEDLDIPDYVCTQMEVRNGVYTGEIAGVPPEGAQKLIQLTKWADTRFGEGNWVVEYAYGDHFSDVPLIETAEHPIVIDPDRRLVGIAKERGWPVLDWPLKTSRDSPSGVSPQQ